MILEMLIRVTFLIFYEAIFSLLSSISHTSPLWDKEHDSTDDFLYSKKGNSFAKRLKKNKKTDLFCLSFEKKPDIF